MIKEIINTRIASGLDPSGLNSEIRKYVNAGFVSQGEIFFHQDPSMSRRQYMCLKMVEYASSEKEAELEATIEQLNSKIYKLEEECAKLEKMLKQVENIQRNKISADNFPGYSIDIAQEIDAAANNWSNNWLSGKEISQICKLYKVTLKELINEFSISLRERDKNIIYMYFEEHCYENIPHKKLMDIAKTFELSSTSIRTIVGAFSRRQMKNLYRIYRATFEERILNIIKQRAEENNE